MDSENLTTYEIEQVLKAKIEYHRNLFRNFEKNQLKLEAAMQQILTKEIQDIARQLLGYYL